MLPARRIGVVAMTTGRLASIIAQRAGVLREIARGDSVRASRQRPLGRPLADFAGTYRHDGAGALQFRVEGKRLHWQWGVLRGVAELFDTSRNAMRIELAGTGYVVEFECPPQGKAIALKTSGMRLVRGAETPPASIPTLPTPHPGRSSP